MKIEMTKKQYEQLINLLNHHNYRDLLNHFILEYNDECECKNTHRCCQKQYNNKQLQLEEELLDISNRYGLGLSIYSSGKEYEAKMTFRTSNKFK